MRRFRVVVNGLVYEVGVEELDEGGPSPATVSPAGSLPAPAPAPAPAREETSHRPRSHAHAGAPAAGTRAATPAPTAGGGEVVEAPLPGTVLDVKVGAGDQVTAGQVLLVLEAMKMENEIVAPRAGTVEEVLVSKGRAVTTGDPLVRIV